MLERCPHWPPQRHENSLWRGWVYALSQSLTSILYRVFFFSSRRRHTRSLCDWSSDVCSSDLQAELCDRQQWDEYLACFDPTAEFHVPQWDSEHVATTDPKREMSMIYYATRGGLDRKSVV